jgi:membrane protease YdiL (CAAX protease family)
MLLRYPIVSYFILSFAIAWSVWIPVGILVAEPSVAVVLPGAWAPTIAAVMLTAATEGRSGVRKLLSGLLKWRAGIRWYLFAILSCTAVAFFAIGIHVLLGGSAPTVEAVAARFGLPAERASSLFAMLPIIYVVTIFTGGPIAEELGWRGYAQARLQLKVGAAPAGVVIGFIWSLWHLPLFFFLPEATGDVPILYYVPLVTAWGVLFGWLYVRTYGSVLLCVLFHAGVNFVLGALGLVAVTGSTRLLAIFVVLWSSTAVLVFLRMKRADGLEPVSDLKTQ